jgi:meso-butanediol dehydrogenase/(S,S)-butanediol dehydrogenase/diacetyl reductase
MSERFDGKTVIVTGAGTGIGAAVARRFGLEGANVTLVGRRREKLEEVAAELPPARTLVHPCDVSDFAAVEAMVAATVERFEGLDVLVANAGVGVLKKFAQTTPADWRSVLSVDLDGVYFCAKAALPHLERSKGSIINVSSVSGVRGDWSMSAYNAAKGGVNNLTRSLALELGSRGIRVNAVAPSLTLTEMTAAVAAQDALVAKFEERIALGRYAYPDDIAGPILFLASDDARYVTGAILPVDGGVTASCGQPRLL